MWVKESWRKSSWAFESRWWWEDPRRNLSFLNTTTTTTTHTHPLSITALPHIASRGCLGP
jgi:hypothetical protein